MTAIARTGRGRPGYSLVEILVVLAIIAVLVSVSAGGYWLVIRSQRGKNTEATIQKLQQALQGQMQAFITQVRNGDIPDHYMAQAGGDRAKAASLWLSQGGRPIPDPTNNSNTIAEPPLLRQEFPETFFNAWWYNARARRALTTAGFGAVPPSNPSESSACLYLALSVGRGGQTFSPDTALEAGVVGSSKPDNVREVKDFRDAWGDPLQFQWVANAKQELEPRITSVNMR